MTKVFAAGFGSVIYMLTKCGHDQCKMVSQKVEQLCSNQFLGHYQQIWATPAPSYRRDVVGILAKSRALLQTLRFYLHISINITIAVTILIV